MIFHLHSMLHKSIFESHSGIYRETGISTYSLSHDYQTWPIVIHPKAHTKNQLAGKNPILPSVSAGAEPYPSLEVIPDTRDEQG